MSYDGGATWSSGPLAAFETHLVMDNQAQVFTYNWHWLTNTNANANGAITYPKSSPTTAASLPSSVCMRAWLAEVGTEESTGLEETCFDLNTTWVSTDAEAHAVADGVAGGAQGDAAVDTGDATSTDSAAVGHEDQSTRPSRPCPNVDGCGHRDPPAPSKGSKSDDAALSASLLFGNWTVACSRSLSICRTMGHVAVDVQAPLIVLPLSGGGQVCEGHGDSCESYKPSGELTWLSYFDGFEEEGGGETVQELTSSSSYPSQRWHWGFDQTRPYDPSAPLVIPSEVCYSIWFVDPVGTNGRTRFVNMSVDEDSLSHWSGYAESETVRCWPVNETAVVYVA